MYFIAKNFVAFKRKFEIISVRFGKNLASIKINLLRLEKLVHNNEQSKHLKTLFLM